MRSRAGRSLAIAIIASIAAVQSAHAHAELVGSEPAENTVVSAAPQRLQLLFSEPIEARFQTIRIYDANRSRVDGGSARVSPVDLRVLEAELRDLTPGSYVVVWRVLSLDGHLARGTFSFGVGIGAQPRLAGAFQSVADGYPVIFDVAVRWGLYLALLVLVGSFAFRPVVFDPALRDAETGGGATPYPTRAYSVIVLALGGALLCHVCGLVLQTASVAEIPLSGVMRGEAIFDVLGSTRYGISWGLRGLLLLALAALVLRLHASSRSVSWWLGAITGSLCLLTLSAAGHASALAADQALVAILIDWIHLVAASIWLGGLAQVALALRDARARSSRSSNRALASRFARVAAVSLGLVLLTGLYAAVQHIPTWQSLVDTAYGAALSSKLLLVLPLLAIGGLNTAILGRHPRGAAQTQRPAAAHPRRQIGALVLVELALGVAIVGGAAILAGQPPATGLVRGQTYWAVQPGSAMDVELVVTPNQAGENRVEVGIRTHPGEPFVIDRVEIRLAMTGMDMEPRSLVATPVGAGRYAITGGFLSMAGRWNAGVRVAGTSSPGAQGVHATFDFTVGQPPQTNRPALSPARILLLAAVSPNLDGTPRMTWSFLGAVIALGLGVALVVGRTVLPGRTSLADIGSRSMLLTSICLLALGVCLGGVALADGYRRDRATEAPISVDVIRRDEPSVERGREVYAWCVACHGIGGRGDGPESQALRPPPSDFRVSMAAGHSDQQVYDRIAEGVPGSSMPAFAKQLSRAQILDVINYLRTFAEVE